MTATKNDPEDRHLAEMMAKQKTSSDTVCILVNTFCQLTGQKGRTRGYRKLSKV